MRIAVLSDIHGNRFACKAVLGAIKADASANGAFDSVTVAGDLCLAGSGPAECVDMLQTAQAACLCGNTEQYIRAPNQTPDDENHRLHWHRILPVVYWARAQLGPERLEWLGGLPFDQRISPTSNPADDLLIVHANPKNVETRIYPPPDQQQGLWDEVRQPDDDSKLAGVMAGVSAAVVAFGHFHYSSVRSWQGKMLVNVSPCSINYHEPDLRARYTVFSWHGQRWDITQRRVPYNARLEAESLRASDMPDAQRYAQYFD